MTDMGALQRFNNMHPLVIRRCNPSMLMLRRVPLWLLPPQTWTGMVTQLIPPNYGIVDGTAFYVNAVVQGRLP